MVVLNMAELNLFVKKVHFQQKRFSLNFIKELYTSSKNYISENKTSLSYLVYANLIATHILNNTCVPKELKITSSKCSDAILNKISEITFNSTFCDLGVMLFDKCKKGVAETNEFCSEILDQSSKRDRIINTLQYLSNAGFITYNHKKGDSNFQIKFNFEFLTIYRNSLNKFFVMPDNLYYIFVSADCSSATLALIYALHSYKERFGRDLIKHFKLQPQYMCTRENVFYYINNSFKEFIMPDLKELKEFFMLFGISKGNVISFSKRAISFLSKIFPKNMFIATSTNKCILTKKFNLYLQLCFSSFKEAIFTNFDKNLLTYIKKAISPTC